MQEMGRMIGPGVLGVRTRSVGRRTCRDPRKGELKKLLVIMFANHSCQDCS